MNFFQKNLDWINKKYEKTDIPKEHLFLKKYYKTKIQKIFLKYYYCMREYKNFTDHTGFSASLSFLQRLANKFEFLICEYKNAKLEMDLDKISLLSERKLKIPDKYQ